MKKSIKLNTILSLIKTGCTILFPLITFPYVSRVLGVSNYGKVNYCISIVGYFTLIASFGVSDYAIREGSRLKNNHQKLQTFVNQVFSINLFVSMLIAILYLVVILNTNIFLGYRVLLLIEGLSIVILPLGIDWFYSIFEDYYYITVRSICIQAISLCMIFAFVKKPQHYVVYAFISIISQSGANIFNYLHSRKYLKIKCTLNINIKKHIRPMLILLAHSIALTIYVNSDITMLGIIKGDKAVGLYSVSTKIYVIIKQLLNTVIMVSMPRLSLYLGEDCKEKYNSLATNIIKTLLLVGLPCEIGLFMLSKEIVFLIGGIQYQDSYISLQILAFSLFFATVACFFSSGVLLTHKKEKFILIGSLSSAVINFLLNFIMIPYLSFVGAAITTLIAEMIICLIVIFYSKQIFVPKIKGELALSSVGSFTIILDCIFVKCMTKNILTTVLASVILSFITYVAVIIVFRTQFINEELSKIQSKISRIIKSN